jgi:hypothetical protein
MSVAIETRMTVGQCITVSRLLKQEHDRLVWKVGNGRARLAREVDRRAETLKMDQDERRDAIIESLTEVIYNIEIDVENAQVEADQLLELRRVFRNNEYRLLIESAAG